MKSKFVDGMKRYAALYIVLALIVLSGITAFVVYAEYTMVTKAKRVIVTGESDVLFSSNILKQNTSSNYVLVRTSAAALGASQQATVCNYSQINPTVANSSAITYTLSVKLVKASGNSTVDAVSGDVSGLQAETENGNQYLVKLLFDNGTTSTTKYINSSNMSDTFTATIPAAVPLSQILSVNFAPSLVDNAANVMLEVKATASSPTGLPELSGLFLPTVATTQVPQTWTGSFTDNLSAPKSPAGFDGFNYEISGNGAGTFTLTWDASELIIDAIFLHDQNLTPVQDSQNSNLYSVTLNVDSTVVSRYDLRFFRVNPIDTSWTQSTLDGEGGLVSYTFSASNS